MDSILQQIDPRTLGTRLQEARKAAGLTQQQVADQLEMARTTIVAIEKGERRVSSKELIQYARIYRRAVSDFVSHRVFTYGFVPQFRSVLDNNDQGDQIGFELQSRAEDFLELESLTGMQAPRLYPPPYETTGADAEQIGEDVANAERARLGMGDGPAPDLRERLATQVGLRIFFFEMPTKVAGVFAYNDILGACTAINLKHPRDRRNWSLAHEYGHFLMTRFQAELTVLFEKKRLSGPERLADRFAECFLMPATGLNRRITELHRSLSSGITVAHICELAYAYQVSVQAMIRRLEGLKRLPHGTWDRLKAEGFKVRQAQKLLDIDIEPTMSEAMPRHFIMMAVYAFKKGMLSEGQLARYLRIDRLAAREVVEKSPATIHAEEEEFATFSSDLGLRLTGS
jgi:Zn-dependent peptidase ImmA (M78 family)/DNA-binding XRE family transcriptional regulator